MGEKPPIRIDVLISSSYNAKVRFQKPRACSENGDADKGVQARVACRRRNPTVRPTCTFENRRVASALRTTAGEALPRRESPGRVESGDPGGRVCAHGGMKDYLEEAK